MVAHQEHEVTPRWCLNAHALVKALCARQTALSPTIPPDIDSISGVVE
jgi:hypothetical protein